MSPSESQSQEWAVDAPLTATRALLELLNEEYRAYEEAKQRGIRVAYVVAQIDGPKVEVFAREEGIPHFRVKIQDLSANFSLADGRLIVGDIGRHERKVRRWFAMGGHRQMLIDAWNSMRPSDCPVGEYHDS